MVFQPTDLKWTLLYVRFMIKKSLNWDKIAIFSSICQTFNSCADKPIYTFVYFLKSSVNFCDFKKPSTWLESKPFEIFSSPKRSHLFWNLKERSASLIIIVGSCEILHFFSLSLLWKNHLALFIDTDLCHWIVSSLIFFSKFHYP